MDVSKLHRSRKPLFILGAAVVLVVLALGLLYWRLFASAAPAPVPAPVASQPAAAPAASTTTSASSATISFVGDLTLSSPEPSTAFDSYYEADGPSYYLSKVASVFADSDYTVGNLEGPITTSTDQSSKGTPPQYWFKAPLSYTKILTDGHINAVTIANNHAYDWGQSGIDQCKQTLSKAGIKYFGYSNYLVCEIKGIKFGFFGLAFDRSKSDISKCVQALKKQGAQVIVAFFHDGTEGSYQVNSSQVQAAHNAVNAGAAAVVFSHPHRLQAVTTYKGAPVAYSLGNFCFGGNTHPSDMDTMILQITFTRAADGSVSAQTKTIPCSISSSATTNDYQPVVLSGQAKARVAAKIKQLSPRP
ncbi:MAG: CapA family protein [Coriobacteriales bacterium]|jgi:poly-gamma-glutamate synthesis protein (capsule biosynthesis protein)|nr:CapA family protein [Coriobacteriales bacterium]